MRKWTSELAGAANSSAVVKSVAIKLLDYCRKNNWAGYDPYDALNSRIVQAIPLLHNKPARLVLTQGVKRSPINLRPVLFIPKTASSKGIALFLSSLVGLSKSGIAEATEPIPLLANKLLSLRSPNTSHSCWGYSFDWQQRSRFVPKDSPNIICSTFAGNALLDAYETTPESRWLREAQSVAEFILDSLFFRESDSKSFFRYTLVGTEQIHNANLLGAAYLCRIASVLGETKYLGPSLEAARFSVSKQHGDGAWDYGEDPSQRWIDNFHTGFDLVALRAIQSYAQTQEFDQAIHRGFLFYLDHFFRRDGAPRYYHDQTYPIDIHSIAQSLITLTEFADLGKDSVGLRSAVLSWALGNMWDKRGFFYYQKRRGFTIRTPFMRWSQAWMLLALARVIGKPADLDEGLP